MSAETFPFSHLVEQSQWCNSGISLSGLELDSTSPNLEPSPDSSDAFALPAGSGLIESWNRQIIQVRHS